MILASIPLWLLAAFFILMGVMALSSIYREEAQPNVTMVKFGLFVACFVLASALGGAASWMVS